MIEEIINVVGPRVSVVYLTKNGGDLFRKSIEAVFSQTVDFEYEVVVVDSGSTDGTLEFLQKYPVRVASILPDQFNFGLTRDFGFSLAKGAILVAISQDAVPAGTDWLQNLVSPFADDSIAVVQCIEVLPKDRKVFYWDKIRLFYNTRDCKKWVRKYSNYALSFACCAIRRKVWEENPLGRVEMSEDKVFQKNIMAKGYKIYVQKKAKSYHAHTYNVKSLAERCENEGLGWRNVGIDYSFFDVLKDIFNPLMFVALIFGLVLFQIRHLSELLFTVIRPIYVFKGNHFTRRYVNDSMHR
jgi:rhamnosyltransferase